MTTEAAEVPQRWPWERREGETAAAFRGFEAYLAAGPGRTLEAAAVRLGGEASARRILSKLQAWAERHEWQTRAQAFDQRDPADGESARSLTYKQRLFISYYLGEAGGNATRAAALAGYSIPGVQGYENLKKPYIRALIDAKVGAVAMGADEVLARLSEIASADMADFVSEDEDGRVRVDLGKARDRGKTHLIRALKPTAHGLAVELHSASDALEKLARFHRLDAGNHGPTPLGGFGGPPTYIEVRRPCREPVKVVEVRVPWPAGEAQAPDAPDGPHNGDSGGAGGA
jgi:phage terminase small subunit